MLLSPCPQPSTLFWLGSCRNESAPYSCHLETIYSSEFSSLPLLSSLQGTIITMAGYSDFRLMVVHCLSVL